MTINMHGQSETFNLSYNTPCLSTEGSATLCLGTEVFSAAITWSDSYMLIFFQYKTLSGLQVLRRVMGSSSFSAKVGCKEISEGPQWLGQKEAKQNISLFP